MQGSSYPAGKEKAGQLSRAEINVTWGRLQRQDLGKRRQEPNYQEKMAIGCSRQRIKEEAEENGGAQVNEHEKSPYAFVPIKLSLLKPEAKLHWVRSMP